MSSKPVKETPALNGFWDATLGIFKILTLVEGWAEKSLEKNKIAFQRWILKGAFTGLTFFMSVVFLVLGLFFIAIDYGGVPRGIVFSCGGLLGLLILGARVSSK